jgi:acetyl esterase/lipase
MIGRIVRILLAAIGVLVVAAGALYLYSPPKALDVLNDFFPGDSGVERVAGNVPFMAGPDGQLDVWARPGSPTARRPVVIFFYGGAWVKGRRVDYGFVGKAYAARGFVVVIPDYRKVPGVRFPTYVEDGARAVRWTHDNVARFGGDPDRVLLAGHSAGGYIAMMLALDQRYLVAAGVDPSTIRGVAGLAGAYNFYPFTSARAVAAMGNVADPRQTQPISFARRDAPPLWLATGTADIDVKPRNAITLAGREAMLGNRTTTLREYPGLTHDDLIMAVSKPFRAKAPVLEESLAFFHHCVDR